MIPSRGIARSLPSVGLRRHISTRSAIQTPAAALRTVNGGRLGSSLRSVGGLTSSSPLRTTYVAAPMALGTMHTSRAFSLWWSGKPSTPEPEQATSAPTASATPATPATPAEAVAPVQKAPEATTVAPETVASAPATNDVTVPTTEIDLASLQDVVNAPDLLNMPDQIGYLHALGLNYGWGPTSVMQWILEHVHVWSGMGWAGSILATAVLLRVVMVYPQVRAQQFNAKMVEMRKDERAQTALKLVRESLAKNDPDLRQKGQFMNKMLQKEYGVNNWEMLWSFGQIPFSYGLFRIVTGMASVPVPSLESSSFLWISNLAQTDPYLIMPAIGTAFLVGSLAINGKYQQPQQRKMMKNMAYVFGFVGFVATCFMSAAVNIMAAGLGACTLITAAILNSAVVRRRLGLPTEVPTDTTAKPQGSYEAPRQPAPGLAGVRERLTANLDDVKKGLNQQMSNMTGSYGETEQERAEKKRKEMIKKLESTRRQQEREEFDRKYKNKN